MPRKIPNITQKYRGNFRPAIRSTGLIPVRCQLPLPSVFVYIGKGFSGNGTVVGVPAKGNVWKLPYQLTAASLRTPQGK